MRKLIDANELIKDLKSWAESIRSIRNDDKVFFTEENILDLINRQKERLVRCKDCNLKHYSESGNLWCDIFDKIMPENGFCCFADGGK